MSSDNRSPHNAHTLHKHLTLGLFGFGCVGQGLYHVLDETQGVKAEIKKICVKHRNKPRVLPEALFTYDKASDHIQIHNFIAIQVCVKSIVAKIGSEH